MKSYFIGGGVMMVLWIAHDWSCGRFKGWFKRNT